VKSVEIFAGAGGMAMGISAAGFNHSAVIERDEYACNTLRRNKYTKDWPIIQSDVANFDYSQINCHIALLSGGPPCQPFSTAGRHKGHTDKRDMFPEAIRAIREVRPRAFIIENVKGIARTAFVPYFSYTLLQLQHPEIQRKHYEDWTDHKIRLERHHTSTRSAPLYNVLFDTLNAADFGIPQKRERLFIVGFRNDQNSRWSFPQKTHSLEELLVSKWVTKRYWDTHKISKNKIPPISLSEKRSLEKLQSSALFPHKPWQTTRDMLIDLVDSKQDPRGTFINHEFKKGARQYKGHTGSLLDMPAKTIKAGFHGVPGGENMFIKDDKTVRYFTVRELARLQGFPDDYVFSGSWSRTLKQLGNAVPVGMAKIVAKSLMETLAD